GPSHTKLEPIEAIKAAVREQRNFESASRAFVGGEAPAVAHALLAHLRPVATIETVVVFRLERGTNELAVWSSAGTHASEIASLRVAVGERIAGWVFAHQQAVLNSEAALDLSDVAPAPPDTLKHAVVMPIRAGSEIIGVAAVYGPDRFTEANRQLFEFAAGLLHLGMQPGPRS